MIRLKNAITAGLVIATTTVIALPVSAEDFTFNVPVTFSRVTENADKVSVACRVCDGACASGNRVGFGSTRFERSEFSNGQTVNRTVTVRFNAEQGKSAGDATHYYCFLAIGVPGRGSGGTRDLGANPPDNLRHKAAKPGFPHVGSVSGTLN